MRCLSIIIFRYSFTIDLYVKLILLIINISPEKYFNQFDINTNLLGNEQNLQCLFLFLCETFLDRSTHFLGMDSSAFVFSSLIRAITMEWLLSCLGVAVIGFVLRDSEKIWALLKIAWVSLPVGTWSGSSLAWGSTWFTGSRAVKSPSFVSHHLLQSVGVFAASALVRIKLTLGFNSIQFSKNEIISNFHVSYMRYLRLIVFTF